MARSKVWSYLTPLSANTPIDTTLTAARGTRVRFLDGVHAQCATSGGGGVNLGYGRAEVADAVHRALHDVTHLPLSHANHLYAERAATALIDVLGPAHFDAVMFSGSVQVANEAVMKLLHHWAVETEQPHRDLVVDLHGFCTVQRERDLAEIIGARDRQPPTHGLHRRHVDPFDATGVDLFLDCYSDRVAAFIIEPILPAGTLTVPPAVIERVLERSITDDFLVIADETTTGFLRTGPLFAHQHWSIKPDIVLLAHGLTNGAMPAAALVHGFRVTTPIRRRQSVFTHDDPHGGTPAACAAMETVVRLARDQVERGDADDNLALLDQGLRAIGNADVVADVRGRGWLRSLSIVDGEGGHVDDTEIHRRCETLRRCGVWTRPGPSAIGVVPPVVSSASDIERILHGLEQGLTTPAATGSPARSCRRAVA